jgi:sn-glycerol 3-phosphate transport system permease protein
MEKRVLFRSSWLPWALLAPQLIIVGVFFFWPAGQALVQSLQQQDAFGNSVTWVGLDNFKALWNDSTYMASFQTTLIFSALVTVLGLSIALVLAVFADRVVRGSRFYRSVLILPYAVAPVVTGLLWSFMFSSSIGIVAYWLKKMGFSWNHLLNGNDAMGAGRDGRRVEADLVQLPVLPGGPAVDSQVADRGRRHRRCAPHAPVLDHPVPAAHAHHVLPARDQHGVRLLRHLRDHRRHHQGGPGKETATLVYRVYFDGFRGMDFGGAAAQSVVLMAIVICLTVLQFRYVEKKVQY